MATSAGETAAEVNTAAADASSDDPVLLYRQVSGYG